MKKVLYSYFLFLLISCSSQNYNAYKVEYCDCLENNINKRIQKYQGNDFDLINEFKYIEYFFLDLNKPSKKDYLDIITGNREVDFLSIINYLESKDFERTIDISLIVKQCPNFAISQLNLKDKSILETQMIINSNEENIEDMLHIYLNSLSDSKFKMVEFRLPLFMMMLRYYIDTK